MLYMLNSSQGLDNIAIRQALGVEVEEVLVGLVSR